MKFSLVAVAFAVAVRAQSSSDIPECALPCLADAIKAKTSCDTTDYACVCPKFAELQGDATPCVIEKCTADVALNKVLPAVNKVCAAATASGKSSAAPSTSASAASSAAASSSGSSASSASKSAATTPTASGTTKPTTNPQPTSASASAVPTTGGAGSLAPLGALAMGALAFAL